MVPLEQKEKEPFKILIVGGGIAGLAAAHALRHLSAKRPQQRKLQVTVYEQDTEEPSSSGYPVHVTPLIHVAHTHICTVRGVQQAIKALRSIISPEAFRDLSKASEHGITHGGITLSTPTFSRIFQVKLDRGEEARPHFVHRYLLKRYLGRGVRVIKRKAAGFRQAYAPEGGSDGEFGLGVEVALEDGSFERADLLVGADGIGSVLRAQISPRHARMPTLPYLVVQFKLDTPLARLPSLVDKEGINMILGRGREGTRTSSLLLIPISGTSTTTRANTTSPVSGQERYCAESPCSPRWKCDAEPTLLHQSEDDEDPAMDYHAHKHVANELSAPSSASGSYILSILTIPYFPTYQDLTQSQWIEQTTTILKQEKANPELIRALQHDVMPDTVGAWQIKSCDTADPVPWERGQRVVLIGDAVHAMSPFAGAGASTALEDAYQLAETVFSSEEMGGAKGKLDDLLPAFHEAMMCRSHAYVREAKRRLRLATRTGVTRCLVWGLMRLVDGAIRLWEGFARTVGSKR